MGRVRSSAIYFPATRDPVKSFRVSDIITETSTPIPLGDCDMDHFHSVEQGEHLASIALKYGFVDYHTIWNHPQNAEIKHVRKDPFVLHPGDRIYIPTKSQKKEAVESSDRHSFVLAPRKIFLRLLLGDFYGLPIANAAYLLETETKTFQLVTDGSGVISQEIPRDARIAKLAILDQVLTIHIGSLDPADARTGQQARLNNLGYWTGEIGSADEDGFRSAVEEFQCDHELPVNGICDTRTQEMLTEVHGC